MEHRRREESSDIEEKKTERKEVRVSIGRKGLEVLVLRDEAYLFLHTADRGVRFRKTHKAKQSI